MISSGQGFLDATLGEGGCNKAGISGVSDRHSVNEGFGKYFKEGNSVKRLGPFSKEPDSDIRNLWLLQVRY